MKTPEEIFETLDEGIRNDLDDWGKYCILNRIKQAQEEAYTLGQIDVLNSFTALSTKINNKIYK